jgi:hypothetical protein
MATNGFGGSCRSSLTPKQEPLAGPPSRPEALAAARRFQGTVLVAWGRVKTDEISIWGTSIHQL